MQIINSINNVLWGIPLIVLVLFVGGFFTVGTGFFQFAHLGWIMKHTFGLLLKRDDGQGDAGVLKPFEAVATAVGGSVGVGNVAGVATAVATGGPGAVFWMWICALVGMMTKMVEVTLAVHYRMTDEKGNPYGGPTYYMERGLGEEMKIGAWPIFAFVFGAGIFTSFFLTVQSYSVAEAVGSVFGIPLMYVAILYAVLCYIIIAGGIPSLGKIAGYLVPIMCIFYIGAGIIILFMDAGNIPSTFATICKSAFTGHAAVGGFVGAAFSQAIQKGVARSVYSNEAGWGTSPMIHSTARTDHPIKQGMWGSFEVFVDTILVCSITGLIIVNTGAFAMLGEDGGQLMGATLTLTAFKVKFGVLGAGAVAVSVFLFGLTTTTGWYAYYEVLLRHLFKKNPEFKDKLLAAYKWVYPIPGFALVVIAVSVGMPGDIIWAIADIAAGIPTFVNLIVLFLLSKSFFRLMKDYKARYMGIGTVDPNFKVFYEDKFK